MADLTENDADLIVLRAMEDELVSRRADSIRDNNLSGVIEHHERLETIRRVITDLFLRGRR